MVALRTRRSGPVPGWNATPNGAVSRLFDAYGMTPMQASAGRARPRAQGQGKSAEEHGVDHDAVGGEVVEDGAQVAALAGQRADEDPAQVVLHAPHAALGRRLALGVGHHQVVGVVRGGEGDEAGTRRLDRVAVVLGREEHDVVPLGDQPARQRHQRRRMALGRRGAQDEAPRVAAVRRTPVAAIAGSLIAPVVDRRPRPRAAAPARRRQPEPSRPCSVLTLTVPWTSPKDTVSLDMLSSTVVRRRRGRRPSARRRGERPVRADGQVLAGLARRNGAPAQLEHRRRGHPPGRPRCTAPGRPWAATGGRPAGVKPPPGSPFQGIGVRSASRPL